MAREPRTTPAGVEDDDGEGYGEREGSESQGRFSGEGYGDDAQGEYGDEDGDPSYDELTDGEADGPVGQEVVERRAARRRTEGPPSDGSLEDEVVDRLVDVLGIDEQDVVVRVTDGVVELDGWVDTLALRDAAETEAANVPGVRGVENHLRQRRGTSEETVTMARNERETSPRKVAERIGNHRRGEENEPQEKLPPRGAAKRSAESRPEGRTPGQAEGDRETIEEDLRRQRGRARH